MADDDQLVFKLVYAPTDAPRQEFKFDAGNPLNLEAEALEAAGGDAWQDYSDWLVRVGSGNIRARRALLWVMLRRTDPSLRFVDVVFHTDEFLIEDADEPEPVGKEEPGDGPTDSESLPQALDPSPSN
jgi:hypothetical protein